MTHDELCERGLKWLARNHPVVVSELKSGANEIPDVIGFRVGVSTLIECKTSRSDFLKGQKKYFRHQPQMGMGYKRFYLCPPGIIKPDDLEKSGWGLLYCHKRSIKIIKESKRFLKRNHRDEIYLLMSCLRREQQPEEYLPKKYRKKIKYYK